MKSITLKITLISLLASMTILVPVTASADWRSGNVGNRASHSRQFDRQIEKRPNIGNPQHRRADNRREYRQDHRQINRQIDRRLDRRFENRHGNRLGLVTPRHRNFRHIVVVRPYGHTYYGYGRFYRDNDAWKWLAFTAITLKLLDMVDEQAQREHEAAQVAATTAYIGEKIHWNTGSASGYVVATKEGVTNSGLVCREFQQLITVNGKSEKAYGKACLQSDGAWKIAK